MSKPRLLVARRVTEAVAERARRESNGIRGRPPARTAAAMSSARKLAASHVSTVALATCGATKAFGSPTGPQRTRAGRLLSKVQPGIRYCIAAASSRAPSASAL